MAFKWNNKLIYFDECSPDWKYLETITNECDNETNTEKIVERWQHLPTNTTHTRQLTRRYPAKVIQRRQIKPFGKMAYEDPSQFTSVGDDVFMEWNPAVFMYGNKLQKYCKEKLKNSNNKVNELIKIKTDYTNVQPAIVDNEIDMTLLDRVNSLYRPNNNAHINFINKHSSNKTTENIKDNPDNNSNYNVDINNNNHSKYNLMNDVNTNENIFTPSRLRNITNGRINNNTENGNNKPDGDNKYTDRHKFDSNTKFDNNRRNGYSRSSSRASYKNNNDTNIFVPRHQRVNENEAVIKLTELGDTTNLTSGDIAEFLRKYNIREFGRINIPTDRKTRKPRDMAFVNFNNLTAAQNAIDIIINTKAKLGYSCVAVELKK